LPVISAAITGQGNVDYDQKSVRIYGHRSRFVDRILRGVLPIARRNEIRRGQGRAAANSDQRPTLQFSTVKQRDMRRSFLFGSKKDFAAFLNL
jgi:hypothetical protein